MSQPEELLDESLRAITERTVELANPGSGRAVAALRRLTARRRTPALPVVVVGEVSRGKSTLVNALVGQRVLPADRTVTTSTWTLIKHGPSLAGQATVQCGDGTIETVPVNTVAALGTYLAVDGQQQLEDLHGAGARCVSMVLEVPSPLLESGLQLIDTPGVGGLRATHRQATLTALAEADAVVFVIRPGEPISASERLFLAEASEQIGTCVVVQTHRDQTLKAKAALDADLASLTDRQQWCALLGDQERADRVVAYFRDVKGISVSSRNALLAQDEPPGPVRDTLLRSSGLQMLTEVLQHDVVAARRRVRQRTELQLVELVLRQTRDRTRETVALLSGDAEAARILEDRRATIGRWVAHGGDLWRRRYRAGCARIPDELQVIVDRRCAELNTDVGRQLAAMKPTEIEKAMKGVLGLPAQVFTELLTEVDTKIAAAAAGVRELLERDGLAQQAHQTDDDGVTFERLGDGTFTRASTNLSVEDLKHATLGGMAGVGIASSGALVLAHAGILPGALAAAAAAGTAGGAAGTGLAATAATIAAPIFWPFVVGAVAFVAIHQVSRVRARTREQARTVLATVREEIAGTALTRALDAAKEVGRMVEEDIEAGIRELHDEADRARRDLADATTLTPAARLARISDAEDLLARVEDLRAEAAALAGRI
ncbi:MULTISPECIES: dynamin family protein [Micromonospora]|uniref:Dynamin family protein n=1 Tax=Micromonospora yangpuensis TaxID=683228 RepID=A0A1C6VGH2_9ACTN|nr:dynamin family protein [Micromonospora yangpuensis]GGL98804.1 hypothetical protein GCM10012279_15320 [Micromonospora yangpuensis]SCL65391.1 Dynamin family protein [Micromonospora yangpuensis]